MAKAVVMPKAGISVESCIIGSWRKKAGDAVSVGDILFDYETDKASFECESAEAGTLLEIFYENGDEVPVLANVCAIGEVGEDVSEFRGQRTEDREPKAEDIEPKAQGIEREAENLSSVIRPLSSGAVSPRARKLAERLGRDPFDARATGPNGRIIERDIQRTEGRGQRTERQEAENLSSVICHLSSDFVDEKFTQIRKVISAGMMKSLSEMAQLTHHHSFDASSLLGFRKQCKDFGENYGMSKITINDIILFVVSRTLAAHPNLNAHLIGGDTIRKFGGAHIGVAMDTPRGLIVPTLFNAHKMTVKEISDEVKKLGEMAQAGKISPDLLQGATFTVSNLGSMGVEMFTPIINPPQVAILGVCGIVTKAREGAKGIETYQSMGLSLTYDHRAVDGAPASRFARDLCLNLENFALLLASEQGAVLGVTR